MRDPWSIDDVERLLAAARAMPGDVGGFPAREWWTGLVLFLLDVPVKVHVALELPRERYDHAAGTIAVPPLVYGVHPLTVEALDALRRPRSSATSDRLFPWPLDGGRLGTMLLRQFRELLFRAGLPHVRGNLFERLRATAQACPDVLDRVDPHRRNVPLRSRPPKYSRGDRADHRAVRRRRTSAAARRAARAVYLIDDGSTRTLRNLLHTEYEPRRLADASPSTIHSYTGAITRLSCFLGSEASLDQLSDELLERFAAWALQTRSPVTVGGYLTAIRTLWKFGWRRRLVDEPPRDNSKPKSERRIPEAWSIDDVGRILDAAAAQPGTLGDVPAGEWWVAFLSVLYETGLRVSAALALEARALDRETGWLTVPAAVQKQRADQVFRLTEPTLALFDRLHCGGSLFPPLPWRHPVQQLTRRYRRIVEAAGLPCGPRDLFHKIRRTHATYVADAFDEHEAQRQLGHSTVQLTIRNYIDPRKLSGRVHAADALPTPQRRQTG